MKQSQYIIVYQRYPRNCFYLVIQNDGSYKFEAGKGKTTTKEEKKKATKFSGAGKIVHIYAFSLFAFEALMAADLKRYPDDYRDGDFATDDNAAMTVLSMAEKYRDNIMIVEV